jgi:hypothetical protein
MEEMRDDKSVEVAELLVGWYGRKEAQSDVGEGTCRREKIVDDGRRKIRMTFERRRDAVL